MKKQKKEWGPNLGPVQVKRAVLQVNLSQLPAEKKRPVWERIKANSPATAALLQSDEFKQQKADLEAVFGPVEVTVDLDTVKQQGEHHGVR